MISRTLAAWVLVVLTAPAALAQASREQLLARAKADLAAGRGAEAARLLADAGDRFGSADALMQLARWQAAQGDASAALVTLRKARTLAPNSEDVLGAYARIALAARAVTPAIVALQALTRMAPGVAENQYLLGIAWMQGGDYAAAAEALQAADRIAPDNARTLAALGIAANARKMYAEARTYLVRAVDLQPDSLEALAALAEAEDGTGALDAAEDHARRVLAKKSDDAAASYALGLVLMKRERFAEARDAFLHAIDVDSTMAKAHYQASLAYARLGDATAADRHVALYRKGMQEGQERLKQLRAATDVAPPEGERP